MRFHLDFETQSYADLTRTGTHVYFSHPSTQITHWTIKVGEETTHWRLDLELLPDADNWPNMYALARMRELIATVGERDIVAHNAGFEYDVLKFLLPRQFGIDTAHLTPRHMDCTMARSLVYGYPGALDKAAAAIGVELRKDKEGAAALKRQRQPAKGYTKPDGSPAFWRELRVEDIEATLREAKVAAVTAKCEGLPPEVFEKNLAKATKNLRAKAEKIANSWIEDFELVSRYNIQDVTVEEAIDEQLPPLSADEFETWVMDQEMNRRGVMLNRPLIEMLDEAVQLASDRADAQVARITGGAVDRASKVKAIKDWLNERGFICTGVSKAKINELATAAQVLEDEAAIKVIEIRRSAGQTAVKKLKAMLEASDIDGMSRNLLQYYGAATGRWAGRLWQPQNIRRLTEDALKQFDTFVKSCDSPQELVDACEMLDIDLFEAIGDAMRSLMVAPPGRYLVSGDFSNIEGRGNAWLAGEEWKLDAFRAFDNKTGPDLYKLAYAKAFGIDPAQVTKAQRQIGKVQELALGYQGGKDAFAKMAAMFGLEFDADVSQELVDRWREAHPAIKTSWRDYQDAAVDAVREPGTKKYAAGGKVVYLVSGRHLYCKVPAGGFIAYAMPGVAEGAFRWKGKTIKSFSVRYKGVDSVTRQYTTKNLYGGLQCENVTQRVARDVMVHKIRQAQAAGFDVRLHVHDELITVDKDPGRAAELKAVMEAPLDWCPGFPIAADCWADQRYIK